VWTLQNTVGVVQKKIGRVWRQKKKSQEGGMPWWWVKNEGSGVCGMRKTIGLRQRLGGGKKNKKNKKIKKIKNKK
jgi:hypothetical protein